MAIIRESDDQRTEPKSPEEQQAAVKAELDRQEDEKKRDEEKRRAHASEVQRQSTDQRQSPQRVSPSAPTSPNTSHGGGVPGTQGSKPASK